MRDNIKKLDTMLYNSLGEIVDCVRPMKRTNQYVYGIEVRIPILTEKGYENERYKLESWYITLPCNEKTHIPTLIDRFKAFIQDKETMKGKSWEELKDYTCHELCDWQWLANENNEIIQNGNVTLVKYAIILKD